MHSSLNKICYKPRQPAVLRNNLAFLKIKVCFPVLLLNIYIFSGNLSPQWRVSENETERVIVSVGLFFGICRQ